VYKNAKFSFQWTGDDAENQRSNRIHGLSFEAAQYVFAGQLTVSRPEGIVERAN
jgi:uncharacterized DUF497 family protein